MPLVTLASEADVVSGRVLVDGRPVTNPRSLVRADASVQIVGDRPLRGMTKLLAGLDALEVDVAGAVCVDIGAAAGGFTAALLARGAARVHAVDVGFGQLRGALRADERVVNRERTNLADLSIDDVVDVVTVDVSYLSLGDAVPQLVRLRLAPDARLLALVKPTFELHAGRVVVDPGRVRDAIALAVDAVDAAAWRTIATTLPLPTGRRGAVEAFLLAYRR